MAKAQKKCSTCYDRGRNDRSAKTYVPPQNKKGDNRNHRGSYQSGYSSGSSGGGCFVTTAVIETLGKGDDCYELSTFRKFRDGWLAQQEKGTQEIKEYYLFAPKIVEKIAKLPDARMIYRNLWCDLIDPCLRLIEAGDMEAARELYKSTMYQLKARYLVNASNN